MCVFCAIGANVCDDYTIYHILETTWKKIDWLWIIHTLNTVAFAFKCTIYVSLKRYFLFLLASLCLCLLRAFSSLKFSVSFTSSVSQRYGRLIGVLFLFCSVVSRCSESNRAVHGQLCISSGCTRMLKPSMAGNDLDWLRIASSIR